MFIIINSKARIGPALQTDRRRERDLRDFCLVKNSRVASRPPASASNQEARKAPRLWGLTGTSIGLKSYAFLSTKTKPPYGGLGFGGERGIRTLETVARLHAFQACAFSHSATSPFIPGSDSRPGPLRPGRSDPDWPEPNRAVPGPQRFWAIGRSIIKGRPPASGGRPLRRRGQGTERGEG